MTCPLLLSVCVNMCGTFQIEVEQKNTPYANIADF